jgi:hypothetical protein
MLARDFFTGETPSYRALRKQKGGPESAFI